MWGISLDASTVWGVSWETWGYNNGVCVCQRRGKQAATVVFLFVTRCCVAECSQATPDSLVGWDRRRPVLTDGRIVYLSDSVSFSFEPFLCAPDPIWEQ